MCEDKTPPAGKRKKSRKHKEKLVKNSEIIGFMAGSCKPSL